MTNLKNIALLALLLACTTLSAHAEITPEQRDTLKGHMARVKQFFQDKKWADASPDTYAVIALKLESAYTVQAYIARGRIFTQSGNLKEAVDDFTEAIAMAPKVTDGGANFKADFAAAYRYRGLAYNESQDWKKAVADFDEALKINARDSESLIGRGEADTHFGGLFNTIKEAPEVNPIDDFNAAVQIDPKSAHAYLARGIFVQGTLIIDDTMKKALPDYDKAIELDPNYAEAWYRRGFVRIYLNGGADGAQQALGDYDKAITLDPKPDYYSARARLRERLPGENSAVIIADYSAALKGDSANPSRYTDRADAQERAPAPDTAQMLADYNAAIDLLKKKLETIEMMAAFGIDENAYSLATVEMSRALSKRGQLYVAKEQPVQALTDFNEALKQIPSSIDALAGRAQIIVRAGKPELAISEISARMAKIREEKDENIATQLFGVRGEAFVAMKRYDEALLDLNQAIKYDSMPGFKIYSKKANWYLLRAVAWENKGDSAHALADLNVATKLDPGIIEKVKGTKFEKDLKPQAADASVLIENGDTPVLHKLMGNEWAAAGSPANAASEYDKAIALDPNYADAYNNRGAAWMDLENFESAERDLDKAISLKQNDARYYANRSTLRLHQQRPADAVADALKTTEIEPNNPRHWGGLAMAQQLNNDYANAEISLNTALKLVEGDKNQKGQLLARIAVVRAAVNQAPTEAELKALFAAISNADLAYLVRATDSEIQRHPDVEALKSLRDSVQSRIKEIKG